MPNTLERVNLFLAALHEQAFFGGEDQQGSMRWHINFYKSRAPYRRYAFRVCGFLLLFFSISLPFMNTLITNPQCQVRFSSTAAWIIALLAAANAFFNWQRTWQNYIQTQLTLQFLLSEWELKTVEAKAATSDDEGMNILKEALARLTNPDNS
jgi:hypothetical protein